VECAGVADECEFGVGGGEDEQGTTEVESCKGDVEMVRPPTATATARLRPRVSPPRLRS
jgi:hypothetical protein